MGDLIKVGIVGFGELGQYLAKSIVESHSETLQIAFIWNRTRSKIEEILKELKLEESLILEDLEDFETRGAHIIVEVAHPSITSRFSERFISSAEYIIGSPTALADESIESKIRRISSSSATTHGIHIPAGALWGAQDIKKMADRGSLTELIVTMKKHPESMKLEGELKTKLENAYKEHNKDNEGEFIVYEGPLRPLCPLAPNNVNTMAAAAIAAHNLGFNKTIGRLVADRRLEAHVIEIEAIGKNGFNVKTVRYNPAKPGAVTGLATYASFLSSLLEVSRSISRNNTSPGIHFC